MKHKDLKKYFFRTNILVLVLNNFMGKMVISYQGFFSVFHKTCSFWYMYFEDFICTHVQLTAILHLLSTIKIPKILVIRVWFL